MSVEHAIIDRFEGDLAVLLVGDEGQVMDVPKSQLPSEAREGHYLQIERQAGQLIRVVIDEEATSRARQRIEEKLNRLRRGDHLRKD